MTIIDNAGARVEFGRRQCIVRVGTVSARASWRAIIVVATLLVGAAGIAVLAIGLGKYTVAPGDVIGVLFGHEHLVRPGGRPGMADAPHADGAADRRRTRGLGRDLPGVDPQCARQPRHHRRQLRRLHRGAGRHRRNRRRLLRRRGRRPGRRPAHRGRRLRPVLPERAGGLSAHRRRYRGQRGA